MPYLISPTPPLSPPRQYPRKYGAIEYWLADTPDSHIYIDVLNDGGVLAQVPACTITADPYNWQLCNPTQKPDADRAVGPTVEAGPRWYSLAVSCSTVGEIDLKAVARASIEDNVQLGLETELSTILQTAAPAPIAEPSLECALAAATNSIAATLGDGRALVHISPGTLTQIQLRSGSNFLKEQADGKLYDSLGNLYHVCPALLPNTIYVETESRYVIYLSEVELLDDYAAKDKIRTDNTRIVRATAGYVLWRSACNTSAWSYPCT